MRDDIDLPNGPAASQDDAADGSDGDANVTAPTDANRELDEQRDRYLRLAAEYDTIGSGRRKSGRKPALARRAIS